MLMQIDGTFIFVVISFVIFLFIINAILYRPFSRAIEERDEFFDKNSKTQQESKEKAQALLDEKENLLKKTRSEAGEFVKKASEDAKNQGEIEISKIKRETSKKIEENKNTLQNEAQSAKQEIKSEISNIVKQITSKILNEDIEINLDDEKIGRYLKI